MQLAIGTRTLFEDVGPSLCLLVLGWLLYFYFSEDLLMLRSEARGARHDRETRSQSVQEIPEMEHM